MENAMHTTEYVYTKRKISTFIQPMSHSIWFTYICCMRDVMHPSHGLNTIVPHPCVNHVLICMLLLPPTRRGSHLSAMYFDTYVVFGHVAPEHVSVACISHSSSLSPLQHWSSYVGVNRCCRTRQASLCAGLDTPTNTRMLGGITACRKGDSADGNGCAK